MSSELRDFPVASLAIADARLVWRYRTFWALRIELAPIDLPEPKFDGKATWMVQQRTFKLSFAYIELPQGPPESDELIMTYPPNPERGYIEDTIYVSNGHQGVCLLALRIRPTPFGLAEMETRLEFEMENEGSGYRSFEVVLRAPLRIETESQP